MQAQPIIEFTGQILPSAKTVTYQLDILRYRIGQKFSIAYADGVVHCDGKKVCTARNLKVGVFSDLSQF